MLLRALIPSGSGLRVGVAVLKNCAVNFAYCKPKIVRNAELEGVLHSVSGGLQRQRQLGEDPASEVNSQVACNRISATVSHLRRGMR